MRNANEINEFWGELVDAREAVAQAVEDAYWARFDYCCELCSTRERWLAGIARAEQDVVRARDDAGLAVRLGRHLPAGPVEAAVRGAGRYCS